MRDRGVNKTIVLIDKKEYVATNEDVNHAGKSYYLDFVESKKTFHPKFCFLVGLDYIKLLVGSFNLTQAGWEGNEEIAAEFEVSTKEMENSNSNVIKDFVSFLKELVQKDQPQSKQHKELVEEIIEEADAILEEVPEEKGDAILLHNLNEPILDQVLRLISESSLEFTRIVSPFWDKKGAVVKRLVDYGCKRFEVLIQKGRVTNFPKKELIKLSQSGTEITAKYIQKKEKSRNIHGKILIFETPDSSYCLFGSPNSTRSALLSTQSNGNTEISILVNGKLGEFNYLLDEKTWERTPVELENVEVSESEMSDTYAKETDSVIFRDVILDGKLLKIELDRLDSLKDVENVQLILRHPGRDEELKLEAKLEGKKITKLLGETALDFCRIATQIQVKLQNREEQPVTLTSRWISHKELSKGISRRILRKGERTAWRYGLLSRLNDLYDEKEESWGKVRFFLENLTIPDLYATGRNKNYSSRAHSIFSSSEEISNTPEKRRGNNEFFRLETIKKYEMKLKRALERIENDEIEFSTAESIINCWVSFSKLTFWLLSIKKISTDNIVKIRSFFDDFVAPAIEKTKDSIDEKEFKNRLEDLNFQGNKVVISYLMEQFYLRNKQGVRKAVHNWFRKKFLRKTLLGLDNQENEKFVRKIDDAIDEYQDKIKSVNLGRREIIDFLKMLSLEDEQFN